MKIITSDLYQKVCLHIERGIYQFLQNIKNKDLMQRSVRSWQVLHLFFGDLKSDFRCGSHLSKSSEFFWVIYSEMLKYSFKTNY